MTIPKRRRKRPTNLFDDVTGGSSSTAPAPTPAPAPRPGALLAPNYGSESLPTSLTDAVDRALNIMRAQAGPQPGHGQVIVGPLRPVGVPRDEAARMAADNLAARAEYLAQSRRRGNPAVQQQEAAALAAAEQAAAPAQRREFAHQMGLAVTAPAMLGGTAARAVLGRGLLRGAAALAEHAGVNGLLSTLPGVATGVLAGDRPEDIARNAVPDFGTGAALGAAMPLALEGGAKALGAFRDYRDLRGVNRLLGDRFGIVTPENPFGRPLAPHLNAQRLADMNRDAETLGLMGRVPARGVYPDVQTGNVLTEHPVVLPGASERETKYLGARYGQNSVMTQKGLHDLQSGTLYPSRGVQLAKSGSEYTEVTLPNGRTVRFKMNLDRDNPVPSTINALPVPKGANPDLLRIKQGMIDNAPGAMHLPRVTTVDAPRAQDMAAVYDRLPVVDPNAAANYEAMNREVAAQLQTLKDNGYLFDTVQHNPYPNSKAMRADMRQHGHLSTFASDAGDSSPLHPFMTPEQNDNLRQVHDAVAHASEGNQFGPIGEDNAYRAHGETLSPLALPALATETRGQNSWVNFGPNAHLPVTERPYATQKAAAWPAEYLGDYASMPPAGSASRPALSLVGKQEGNLGFSDEQKAILDKAGLTYPADPAAQQKIIEDMNARGARFGLFKRPQLTAAEAPPTPSVSAPAPAGAPITPLFPNGAPAGAELRAPLMPERSRAEIDQLMETRTTRPENALLTPEQEEAFAARGVSVPQDPAVRAKLVQYMNERRAAIAKGVRTPDGGIAPNPDAAQALRLYTRRADNGMLSMEQREAFDHFGIPVTAGPDQSARLALKASQAGVRPLSPDLREGFRRFGVMGGLNKAADARVVEDMRRARVRLDPSLDPKGWGDYPFGPELAREPSPPINSTVPTPEPTPVTPLRPATDPAAAAPMVRVPTDFERNAASSLTDVLRDARATGSSGLATPRSAPQSVYDAAGGAPGLITRATGAGIGTLAGASQGDTNQERLRNAAIGGLTGFTGAAMLREAVPWLAEHIPETPGARFGDVLVGGEGGPGMRARPGVLGYHATFNQFDPKAIRGKPGDVGIHFATTKEQAMERAAAHAIHNNMHLNVNNVSGPHMLGLDPTTWRYAPRLLEADLNVKNPLEVSDLGNWDPSAVRVALQDSGFETPRSVLHQSDAAAQRAFRQILRKAGHDAYSYINEGEVPGMASGHFLPPLPQGLYVPFKQALYENQQEALVPFSRKQIQGIQEIDPVPLHNILDDLDLSELPPEEQELLNNWFSAHENALGNEPLNIWWHPSTKKGAVDPRLLTRGAGAATGALAGATQGNTPGERARNAALGAGVGLAGARALEELPKLGPGVRNFWNDESGALRFRPKQADLPRAGGKNTPPELKNEVLERTYNALGTRRAQENFARGMEDPTASRWYDPQPLLQLMAEGAGDAAAPENLRTFGQYMAATTAKTNPWDNVKRALLFRGLEMRGMLTPEALRGKLAVPEGFGHYAGAGHQKSIAKMLEAGALDPITQAKGASFAANIAGNHRPVTVDQKMMELFRDLDPKLAELAMTGDAPKTWAYPLLERAAQQRAQEALARGDFETAQKWLDANASYQAIHWVGKQRGLTTGRAGGLKAAEINSRARNAGTLADIVKRQIDTGANLFGIKPSKVNEALWREGHPPLLPPGAPLLRR